MKIFIIIIVLLVIILIWQIWENNSLSVSHIKYTNSKIPKAFKGYRIVQISDLHNKQFGKNQSKLIERIKECNPDIVVITGDLVDDKRCSLDVSLEMSTSFVTQVSEIAPVYYVAGNHEAYTGEYKKIKQKLSETNINMLDNESVVISKNEEELMLIGVLDPYFYGGSESSNSKKLNNELKELSDNDYFKVLLSHRPELMDIYVDNKIDLVFAGHAHGGQFRIPLIGGIIAPSQGFFPKYIDGEYVENDTTMIVSRGLGASIIPIRIFNKPEIVLVEL